MTSNDKEKEYMAGLAFTIIVLTFGLGYILLTTEIPEKNQSAVNVALGLILGLSGTVVGYYFGSSKSSSDKTVAMSSKKKKVISDES